MNSLLVLGRNDKCQLFLALKGVPIIEMINISILTHLLNIVLKLSCTFPETLSPF